MIHKLLSTLIFFSSVANAVPGSLYVDKFKSIDLGKVEYADVCTGKKVQVKPDEAIELWSINCGNCLQKIEDKVSPRAVLVNVDEKPSDRVKSCAWLRSKNLNGLVDVKHSIRAQLGGNYPIPSELIVRNGKVHSAIIGYWRDGEVK